MIFNYVIFVICINNLVPYKGITKCLYNNYKLVINIICIHENKAKLGIITMK